MSAFKSTISTRRFFAIIEYQHTNGMSGAFEDIASSLETIAAMLKSTLRECGNTILDTGDTTAGVDSILYEFLNRRASFRLRFTLTEFFQPMILQKRHWMKMVNQVPQWLRQMN